MSKANKQLLHSVLHHCVNIGALFAFVSSVEALATILGSAVFINLYSALHQQSYFIMGTLAFTAAIPLL